ncbi:competence protein ComEA [Paenibacillus sp. HJL G12]|uniref:Competence protein ComEA n=1 Tax=Paenibacillus dendrobii TaxID=2691084 RepID=A0A7X3IME8_9BACL|nr:ComEA family DNA-binding protein [Paenibacillus dendrobii]MWV45330.1 competence protein ComEA [Paenibacillus dendrobii]
MKRLSLGISVCCALLGSAVILLSGMKHGDGIQEWKPMNDKLEIALEEEHKPAQASPAATASTHAESIVQDHPKEPSAEPATVNPTAQNLPASQAGTAAGLPEPQSAASEPSTTAAPPGHQTDSSPSTEGSAARKINVNTAQAAELMNLPGIGAKKAQAIIEYRTQHGPFQKVSDLDKVKGIGAKVLEKMKAYVEL